VFIYPTCMLSGVAPPFPRVILVGIKEHLAPVFLEGLNTSQLTADYDLIFSSHRRVRLIGLAEVAAVSQRGASVTVRSP